MRILLIEDNEDLAQTVKERLCLTYSVDWVATGTAGAYLAQINPYDLAIIDIGLPDIGGVEVCARLRAERVAIPILMLTAQRNIEDKVNALDQGADDYLTKPFQFPELLARIRALIRRGPSQIASEHLSFGDLTLNTANRTAYYHEAFIPLKRKEFDILELFMRNQNAVITRSMIMDHAWDSGVNELTNSIDVHIGRLRKIIQKIVGRQIIHTVYGFGYRMSEIPVSASHSS